MTYFVAEWWEAEKAALDDAAIRRMNWEAFKTKFLGKYFLQSERDKKEREFMDLVQGNLSVQEYTVQFEQLSRFAPHVIDAPEKKNKKYVKKIPCQSKDML